jgi:hypothetical protein
MGNQKVICKNYGCPFVAIKKYLRFHTIKAEIDCDIDRLRLFCS